MSLINCKVNIFWILSANCIIVYIDVANEGITFAITQTRIYVPVFTLSKPEFLTPNPNLNQLVKTSIHWLKTLFHLAFETEMIHKELAEKDIMSQI